MIENMQESLKSRTEMSVTPSTSSAETRPVYQELPSSGHEMDVVQQLRANIKQLEDLQGQLGFVIGELKSSAKRVSRS